MPEQGEKYLEDIQTFNEQQLLVSVSAFSSPIGKRGKQKPPIALFCFTRFL